MDVYKKIAHETIGQYAKRPGLIGILCIGSSTYGIVDKHVDLDIRLVMKSDTKSRPMDQKIIHNIKIEVDEISYKWLTSDTAPDSEQYWIRTKAHILYDPKHTIGNIFIRQNSIAKSLVDKYIWSIYKNVFSDYEIIKCIERKEYETAAMYLYKSLDAFIKLIFIFHNEPVPTFKWRLFFLKKSRYLSEVYMKKIQRILLSTDSLELKLHILKHIQHKAQKMMIDRGIDKKMAVEYWRY